MEDKEIESFKLLKLKYRKGDQKIQSFFRICSLKKLGAPSLI